MAMLDYMHKQIDRFCPIHGLSQFGDEIIIHFKDGNTPEQNEKAKEYVKNFVWTDEMEKAECAKDKVESYKNDLVMKSGYVSYRKENPNTSFSDYINYLEALKI